MRIQYFPIIFKMRLQIGLCCKCESLSLAVGAKLIYTDCVPPLTQKKKYLSEWMVQKL